MKAEDVFFQAEDGIRDLVRSRGLGDVYKRQVVKRNPEAGVGANSFNKEDALKIRGVINVVDIEACLLYTSDAADERSSVDLGGRRIIKKKNPIEHTKHRRAHKNQETTYDLEIELIIYKTNKANV